MTRISPAADDLLKFETCCVQRFILGCVEYLHTNHYFVISPHSIDILVIVVAIHCSLRGTNWMCVKYISVVHFQVFVLCNFFIGTIPLCRSNLTL